MTDATPDTAFLTAFGATPGEVADSLRAALADFEEDLQRTRDRWLVPVRDFAPHPKYHGEWSPAQQAEHVLKANTGFSKIIYLLSGDRELPAVPAERGPTRDGLRVSPPNFLPGEGEAWETLEPRWREASARLLAEVERIDSNNKRTWWHPYLGDLGALDWARVAAWHARDHRRQLGVA